VVVEAGEPVMSAEEPVAADERPGDGDAYEVQEGAEQVKEPMGEMSADEAPETAELAEVVTAMTGKESPEGVPPNGVEAEHSEGPTEEQTDVQELVDASLLPWKEPSEPMNSLVQGAVVHGRYQVVELLSREEEEALYRVRDLQRCPKCGFEGNGPDEAFCGSCGAAMDQKPKAIMLERSQDEGRPVEADVEDHFADGERSYWVWRERKGTGPLGGGEEAMRLIVGLKSDTGQVRELDEDGLLALTMSSVSEPATRQIGLFVVADGMGGHEAGEVASKVAIQTVGRELVHNVLLPELEGQLLSLDQIQDWMRRAVETANDQVYLERQKRDNDMGTTVTVALVIDWALHLAHVGDCRAYRWGEDGLEQLTTDHSIVATMIAAGSVQPEEIYTHPQRSVIYRCVGDQPTVDVEVDTLLLSPGDRLILCCDGLWEMTHDEGIEDVMMRESDPQTASDVLVDQANLAGGVDNISVIVVQL
jgi:serine/threonine protein phosphatase PrpC